VRTSRKDEFDSELLLEPDDELPAPDDIELLLPVLDPELDSL